MPKKNVFCGLVSMCTMILGVGNRFANIHGADVGDNDP